MCFAGDQTHNTGMLDKHSTAALYPQLHFNILILEKLLNNLTLVIIPLKKKKTIGKVKQTSRVVHIQQDDLCYAQSNPATEQWQILMCLQYDRISQPSLFRLR